MSTQQGQSDPDAVIRKYGVADRESVRRIAVATIDKGEPSDIFDSFAESIADILTRYYTDFESQSVWIAQVDGRVIGYIVGSLNERRYRALMGWRIVPSAIAGAVIEGALWRKKTWRLLPGAFSALRALDPPSRVKDDRHPSHLHISIEKGHRSRGTGRRLVETFERYAREARATSLHARVRGDNEAGRKFFERMGFAAVHESRPMMSYSGNGRRKSYTIVTYVKKIEENKPGD